MCLSITGSNPITLCELPGIRPGQKPLCDNRKRRRPMDIQDVNITEKEIETYRARL